MTFKEKVMASRCFNNWMPITQRLALRGNNLRILQHGFTVAMNIGLDRWERQTGFSERNKILIRELVDQHYKNQTIK